jgi:hypothetical protein
MITAPSRLACGFVKQPFARYEQRTRSLQPKGKREMKIKTNIKTGVGMRIDENGAK